MREQRGPGEVDADPVHRLQRTRPRVLHVEDRDLHRRRAPPAVRLGPVDADPAVGRELRLPRAGPTRPRRRASRSAAGSSSCAASHAADLGRERCLFGGEREIHELRRSWNPTGGEADIDVSLFCPDERRPRRRGRPALPLRPRPAPRALGRRVRGRAARRRPPATGRSC